MSVKVTTKLYLKHMGITLLMCFVSLITIKIIIKNDIPTYVAISALLSVFSGAILNSIKEAYVKGAKSSCCECGEAKNER